MEHSADGDYPAQLPHAQNANLAITSKRIRFLVRNSQRICKTNTHSTWLQTHSQHLPPQSNSSQDGNPGQVKHLQVHSKHQSQTARHTTAQTINMKTLHIAHSVCKVTSQHKIYNSAWMATHHARSQTTQHISARNALMRNPTTSTNQLIYVKSARKCSTTVKTAMQHKTSAWNASHQQGQSSTQQPKHAYQSKVATYPTDSQPV